MKMWW